MTLFRQIVPYSLKIVPYSILVLCALWGSAQEPTPKKKKAPAVPEGVEVIRDIEYAVHEGHSLTLDVYRPMDWADYDSTPVVIWIHGGGWKNGSKERCLATYLAQDNLAVVSINYRLIDKGQWPDQIDDCYAAVRWVREHAATYGFGEKIGVWGSSAGGHLAALVGTRRYPGEETISSQVQAVCDFFGPSDLLTMPYNMVSETRTREQVAQSNGAKLLGAPVPDVPELAHDASALHQVSADDPPFLIIHGDQDPGVPIEQSRRLDEALRAAGVDSTFIPLEGAKHGGEEFKTEQVRGLVKAFFQMHLL